MTVPIGGPYSIGTGGNVNGEFGLAANAVFPTAFYGKGGAPASGALSFGDFSGRSGVTFTPDGGTVEDLAPYNASATLTCTASAVWTFTGGGPGASANIASGASATSITFSVLSAGSPPDRTERSASWTVTGNSGGTIRNFTVNLTAFGDP